MADAFSSSSETVLQRAVEASVKTNVPAEKLEEFYQIKKTCDFISERQFEKARAPFFFYFTSQSCQHFSPFQYKSMKAYSELQ